MVSRIYLPELQLNKANTSDTEAPFLDLHLSISNGFVSSKIYDKRDDFDFALGKRLRICSVISVNYHYITVLCPFNFLTLLNPTILYKTNLNKYK